MAPYRRRSIVEQTICWLNECRRIGTCFDKLANSFLAMIQRCLGIAIPDRT
jgi:transposase